MSAFLGNIHYWLYKKIQLHEKLENEIFVFAKSIKSSVEMLENEVYDKYGALDARALEEVVDQGNIHGWLQARIKRIELRLAETITKLIKNFEISIDEIRRVYEKNGAVSFNSLGSTELSPEDLFNLIFDFLLEGMPCDRVNEIVNNTDTEFSWNTTHCVHTQYWEDVEGDVSNFYTLRESWMKGFIEAAGSEFIYTHNKNGLNTIRRI